MISLLEYVFAYRSIHVWQKKKWDFRVVGKRFSFIDHFEGWGKEFRSDIGSSSSPLCPWPSLVKLWQFPLLGGLRIRVIGTDV